MRISVIGTNGLLSDALGRFCNRNNIEIDTYGLTPPENVKYNSFYRIDLRHEDLPSEKIILSDMIVFAAGAGVQANLKENAEVIYTLNTFTPINLCNRLKQLQYSGTFITFGSYFEIGENSVDKYFTENEVLQSQNRVANDYSISKRLLSRFICSAEFPFRVFHFILPTIYGEYESAHRLIPYTLNALKTKAELQFTSGEQIRQYIYIDDILEIIRKAYDYSISSGVYNIPGVETLSVKELVSSLFKIYSREIPDSLFGKVKRVDIGMKILKLDGMKLTKLIDYQPSTKILDVHDRYRFS